MTREEWAERLPLIQAFVEGKTIQGKWKDMVDDPWEDLDSGDIEFNMKGQEYRIKPEPKVIWVIDDGSDLVVFNHKPPSSKCKKYVEVVE